MWRLGLFVRGSKHCGSLLRITSERSTSLVRSCTSSVNIRHVKNIRRRWLIIVPGIGLPILAATQWDYLHKHGYSIDVHDRPELLNDVMVISRHKEEEICVNLAELFNEISRILLSQVTCYCCLPLRMTSRIWGWLTSIELPVGLRPKLYGFYANLFHANLDEIELDLSAFPNLVEFFVRALKHNARPIATNTNMISPADGKVLYFGPVISCHVEQVKGVTYDLRQFLGDVNNSNLSNKVKDDYVNSILKNPKDNRLYQVIIYLAPGDYHRFHSPTDWNIKFRRHFPGKLLSVNPKLLKFMPNLFSLNERVVYVGEWTNGFMAYTAIGATNVGSIRVYCDGSLATNTVQWPEMAHPKEANLDYVRIAKGELFGEFRLGSTIVLLFEAPRDFQFNLQVGQTIKVGQALSTHFNEETEKRQIERRHLIMDVAQDWGHIWNRDIESRMIK